MMHKVIAGIAPWFKGRAAFGKVDVDLNQALSAQLRISGVPTVMIFKRGERVDRISGVDPGLEGRIESILI